VTPERWNRLKDVLSVALKRPSTERHAVLDEACGDDHALRGEVEALLDSQQRMGHFLEQPLVAAAVESAVESPLMLPRVGNYRLVRTLGEGGMGVVYEAFDERLQRAVALKMIRPEIAFGPAHERFVREARAAAAVQHPHVCQIYEVGECEGRPFLVMELLDGEPLSARLNRGPVPAREAVEMAVAVLSALHALHERGLVHRDIKPSNIFLTHHGVRLLDFGLAAQIGDVSRTALTLPGIILGTPQYMAPEQLLGERVDARTDVFGTAVVLFEMLAGRPPFSGDTALEILRSVLNDHPPALVGSPLVAALDRAIARALSRRAAERHASAAEFADELNRSLTRVDSGSSPRVVVITRLAVLPFRASSADPEVDFVAAVLPDVITSSLSGRESLVVRSHLTAAKFAGSVDLMDVALTLDVDHVLTGTLARAGNQVRLLAQLVETPDGRVTWSQTFEAPLNDLFQLQDDLARRVVETLPLARDDHRHSPTADAPASPRAYELYLRATQLSHEPATWQMARDLYVKCLELDPDYAPAWARIGRVERLLAKFTNAPPGALDRIEQAFSRALTLNPDLAIAHALYAYFEVEQGRAEDALHRLAGRLRVQASHPELFAALCVSARYAGLLEVSIAAHERARRLDPGVRTSIVHTLFMAGEYLRALDESAWSTDAIVCVCYWQLGRTIEALDVLTQEGARYRSSTLGLLLGAIEAAIRDERTVVLRLADELVAAGFRDGEGFYHLGRVLARVGADDQAVAALERALTLGFFCYPAAARDDFLDPLRSRSDFRDWLERVRRRSDNALRAFERADGYRLMGLAPDGRT
jgi:serine/threonine protein kinase